MSALVIPFFISHRGCPHQCLFCNQYSIAGRNGGNAKEDGSVTGTVDRWLDRSPGHELVQAAFYGGSFTCLDPEEQDRLLDEVKPFIDEGRVDSIRLSTRPDCLSPEIIERLRGKGVATVELGVQSLDDRVLRIARRGHTADESRRAVKWLKESGMQVGVQLLPGLPGETTVSFLNGVKEVVAMAPDLVRLYPALVVDHSDLAEMYRRNEYRPISMNRAVGLCRRAKDLFDTVGVQVVRMGLQPSESLEKELVAGPYHPAFGELVRSRQWLRRIRKRLGELRAGETVQVHISSKDHSAVAGMKRMNMRRLEALGFGGRFKIVAEQERERGSVSYVVSKSS